MRLPVQDRQVGQQLDRFRAGRSAAGTDDLGPAEQVHPHRRPCSGLRRSGAGCDAAAGGVVVVAVCGAGRDVGRGGWRRRRAVRTRRWCGCGLRPVAGRWCRRVMSSPSGCRVRSACRGVHRSPGACRQSLAASARSGVKRCTQRKTVTWSTCNTAFQQQFFNVAVGEAVAQVPAHRDHDHLGSEPEPGERRTSRRDRASTSCALHRSSAPRSCRTANATAPFP